MAGSPKKRARRAAMSDAAGSRARGQQRPRFAPASDDDFALVQAGVDRAAMLAGEAARAQKPAERVEALTAFGLVPTGRARDDKRMLEAVARVRRDEGIIAAWALGLTNPTIATKFDLSAEHVARIIAAHRERRARMPLPASSELLLDALEALEAQMERLMLLASDSKTSESARVGAVRTWRDMWLSRLELLQVMGHITQAPSAEARLARARDLLRGLLDALRAEGVEQGVLDRVATRVLSGDTADLENVTAIDVRSSR